LQVSWSQPAEIWAEAKTMQLATVPDN